MVAINNREKCCRCAGCIIVCPKQAIEMPEEGITIDPKKCIDCGACVKVCPAGAMSLKK